MKFLSLTSVFGLATMAHAHMEMSWPPAFNSKFNPNTPQASIDYSMTNPLLASGSNYPCKGYHSIFDTPAGKSVVQWQAGQRYNFTIVGSATHNGGSCQASLSYDRGKTWTVVKSFIGGCPLKPTWDFTLPNDTPTGEAIFSWTWFNQIGNREMYMNCAHVTITGRSNVAQRSPSDPFKGRPAQFVANVGNRCGTLEGKDLLFPQPGPDVDLASSNTSPPTGTCARAKRFAMPLKA